MLYSSIKNKFGSLGYISYVRSLNYKYLVDFSNLLAQLKMKFLTDDWIRRDVRRGRKDPSAQA